MLNKTCCLGKLLLSAVPIQCPSSAGVVGYSISRRHLRSFSRFNRPHRMISHNRLLRSPYLKPCVIIIILLLILQDTSLPSQKARQSRVRRVWTLKRWGPLQVPKVMQWDFNIFMEVYRFQRRSHRYDSFTPRLQTFFGVCMCF